jgi:putative transposase
LTGLAARDRARALDRFRVLRPHLDDGVPLAAVARTAGVPLRTLERWTQRYRTRGLVGLAHAPRADRGRRRFPAEVIGLIEGLALRRPPPTAAAIHRQLLGIAAQQGWPAPSYRTVCAVVHALDPGLVTLAHDGTKAYRERFDLVHRREADGPNAIWQADHTQLDLWVRDERERPAKPRLSVILDDHSRAVAGYRLGFAAPTALQTALALRDAIRQKTDPQWHVCGIPATFYTDHGADFTSMHLEQVAADLKMVLVFSTIGQPRGRGRIERFFQTVTQLFLCTLPGYTPPGSPPAVPVLTLAELDDRLRRFLLDDYHHRIHGETRVAPQARWEAGGFLPRLPESADQLDLLLLTVAKTRRVQRDGIRFQGFRYLDPNLAAYVGEWVTIRYDPGDLAELRIYHRDRFLCRAICPELAGTTIGLKDLERARNARRRDLRTRLGERADLVERLLAVHAEPPPVSVPAVPPPARRLKRYLNE